MQWDIEVHARPSPGASDDGDNWRALGASFWEGVGLSVARKLALAGMAPLSLDFELSLDDRLVFQGSTSRIPGWTGDW